VRELERIREEKQCVVCLDRDKNTAFDCGHQVCWECAGPLTTCPICRKRIGAKIKLFS